MKQSQTKAKPKSKDLSTLRKKAEKKLNEQTARLDKISPRDVKKLVHELGTYQIELEIQNEELRRATNELEESRRKYSDLYDFAPVGYFTFDGKGLIKEVNLTGAQMLGIDKRLLKNKPLSVFIAGAVERNIFRSHLTEVMEKQIKQTCEIKIRRKDGTEFFVQLESIPVEDSSGDTTLIRTAVSDITERERSEEEIKRFASFPQLNPNPVLEVSSAGQIKFFNKATITILKELHLGEDVRVFLPDDVDKILKALEQKEEREFRRLVNIKDRIFGEVLHPVPEFDAVRIYAHDITGRMQAEKALRESESKYRSLFANMMSGFAYHQILFNENGEPVDYVFLDINDAFERLTGLKREKIIGKKVTEVIPAIKKDPAYWIGTYARIALMGEEIRFENYSEALKKWYSVSAYSPQKGYFLTIFDDITKRKQTEEELRESEERLRLSQQAAHIGTFDWNIQTGVNIWTPELEAMYGLRPGEFVKTQKGWEQLIHPDDRAEVVRKVELAFQTGQPAEGEWRVNWPDGSMHWVTGRWQVLKDKSGKPLRMTGVNLDITERKRMEEALRQSRQDLDRAQEVGQIGWWRLDTRHNVLTWSDENHRIFGVPKGTPLTYEAFMDIVHPDDRRYVDTQWNAGLRGEPYDIEHRIVADGRVKWVREKAYLEFDSDGKLLGGFGITQDITELKQAEERLKEAKEELEIRIQERTADLEKAMKALETSEHKYRMLIEQAADGIVLLDRQLNIVDVNSTACNMTGFSREELLKLNAMDLYQPVELESRPLRLDEVLAGGTVITERKATKKDGSPIEVEISAKLIEGGHIQAIVRDVTERKTEERRSRLVTELLGLFVRKTSRKEYLDSVVQLIHDWTGCRSVGIRVVNEERYLPYDSYIGFSPEFMKKEDMISLDSDACACIRVVAGKFEPQDAPALTPNGSFRLDNSFQFADQLTPKEMARFRGNCIRSGYASISVTPIWYLDQPLGAIHLADERKGMVPLETVRFLESTAAPLIGEAIHRFNMEAEVVESRNNLEIRVQERTKELAEMAEELKRSNSDLQQFAYAASHDLQEPLRVVGGFVKLIEKRYKGQLDEKGHEYIEYTVEGVKRMQVLIKDLLEYSQVGTKAKTFRPTNCSVALEEAIYNLHMAIEDNNVELTYDLLPTVMAESSQLTRLFQNLIGNAIKFRGSKPPKIHISAEQKGHEWIFSVKDNGIGIDPKHFERIFVVFQRLHTREEYQGTGIGLAICKKIVERHGGHMWVESEQGKGSTFYFTVPTVE